MEQDFSSLPDEALTPEQRRRKQEALAGVVAQIGSGQQAQADIQAKANMAKEVSAAVAPPQPPRSFVVPGSLAPKPAPAPEPVESAKDFVQPPAPVAPQAGMGATPPPGVLTQVQSESSTSQKLLNTEGYDAAQKKADESAAASDLAQQELTLATATEQFARADKIAADTAELQKRQQENMAAQQRASDLFKARFDEYSNTSVVNPWSNMSTGAKLMSALSIGLGGLAGAPEGKNVGLDIINDTIKRDIELQKANMDKKKGELTLIQQYGQELRQQGLDDRQIFEGMLALGQKQFDMKIDAMQKVINPKDPKYPQILAIQAKRAQERVPQELEVAKFGATTVQKSAATTTAIGKGGAGAAPKELEEKATRELLDKENVLYNYKRLEQVANTSKEEMGKIMGTINKYAQAWNLAGGNWYKLDEETQNAIAQAIKAQSGAQVTDAEREWLTSYFPSTTNDITQFQARLANQLNRGKENYLRELDTREQRGENVAPWRERFNRDFTPPTGIKKQP
jgi:hypothetical protein